MNDASRIYYGTKTLIDPNASPYRPNNRGPRAAARPHGAAGRVETPAQGAHPIAQDDFEWPQPSASLHHGTYAYAPVDIGVPELDDDGADAFAAPPLDLDELAACAGQSRMFGPVVGRAIMVAGSYFAVTATVAAIVALGQDKLTLRGLKELTGKLQQRGPTAAVNALRSAVRREMAERQEARRANWVLLPGALGMSVNLLGSAELLGGLLPALQPLAAFAMGPAAICMALYGGYIALTSLQSWRRSRASSAARAEAPCPGAMKPERWRRARQHNLDREGSRRRWDMALGTSGALQAVGALAQWLLGPIWLLVLLPGTVGLVAGKILRARRLGASTVPVSLQPEHYDCPQPQMAERAVQAQRRVRRLTALKKELPQSLANPALLRAHLASVLQTLDPSDKAQQMRLDRLHDQLLREPASPQREAQQLVAAVAALGGFAYLALEVARDLKLPATAGAREDRVSYTITGADVVNLVALAPRDQQADVLRQLRRVVGQVATSYGVAIAQQQEGLTAELLGHMMEHEPGGAPSPSP